MTKFCKDWVSDPWHCPSELCEATIFPAPAKDSRKNLFKSSPCLAKVMEAETFVANEDKWFKDIAVREIKEIGRNHEKRCAREK